jgi:predicted cupin superfamily sugar epimerase
MKASRLSADAVIELLELKPLPHEGGFFRRVWESVHTFTPDDRELGDGRRPVGSVIYALLRPGDFSAMHRLKSDENWHFHAGDALLQLQLLPDGSAREVRLGADLSAGEQPWLCVRAGVWQGTRVVDGGAWSLFSCSMAPAFEWSDFELGDRTNLQERYPLHAVRIGELTR